MYGIYANIWGILMVNVSMYIYIYHTSILWVMIHNDTTWYYWMRMIMKEIDGNSDCLGNIWFRRESYTQRLIFVMDHYLINIHWRKCKMHAHITLLETWSLWWNQPTWIIHEIRHQVYRYLISNSLNPINTTLFDGLCNPQTVLHRKSNMNGFVTLNQFGK